ncbi:DUF1080 domain-containing protein [Bacteroidota bacterium]|jgi:hypothetical protein
MKIFIPVVLLILLVSWTYLNIGKQDGNWIALWNGKDLTGWHTFLGTPYQSKEDDAGNKIIPFGIDHDPLQVIKVVDTDQGKAIRISGVAWGMIYTEKIFQNYHLKLKVKWGKDMHIPRENGPRDSGLLYHGNGEPGSELAYPWMNSQELQIQQGDMGDYWPVGDTEIDIPSVRFKDNYFIYKENADLRTYYLATILKTAVNDSLAKRRVFKALDAEKQYGKWNEVELITMGDSSIHIVNGKVVMRLYNSRKMSDKQPLKSGRIMIQSEGAEVFYKDFYLKNITEIPVEFKK